MPFYVNLTDWHNISENGRCTIREMLHEQRLLEDDQHLIPRMGYPSLLDEDAPSPLDPELAANLRLAVRAGLEAVIIVLHTPENEATEDTWFIVASMENGPKEIARKGNCEKETTAEL